MKTTVILLICVVPAVLCELVHHNILTPEEARGFLEKQSLDLKYAKLLEQHPIPFGRSDEGPREYWYRGRKIDNPDDYVEEVYDVNQFHGQDGEGRALFGYSDNQQSRVEAINGVGDVRGSYKWLTPSGEEIEVKYWADSLGFHQTDNRPVVELKPVEETEEVRAAREAHQKAWEEAAAAASNNPDPNSDIYNRAAIARDEEISRREQEQELMRAAQEEERMLKLQQQARAYEESEEPKGEPRGFFYSVNYPAPVIVPKEGHAEVRAYQQQRALEGAASEIQAVAVKPDNARISEIAHNEGAIPVDAVHDAQVHPKLMAGIVNSQKLPVHS
ncbi:uncharacterized protein LOC134830429 [Culicoides brevitarsis]|uniref:uncharacterized protein LOC134830429 n=1 Tax=Culicoides brevitarsis TaxID=469753 RepID=UPI00307B5FBC